MDGKRFPRATTEPVIRQMRAVVVDSNVAVTEWFRKYRQVPTEGAPTRP